MQEQEPQRARVSPDEDAPRRLEKRLDGQYAIRGVLGDGGMATVYSAMTDIGNRVAIKVMHERLSNDLHGERQFLKEALLSNTVNHPAVVQITGHGVTKQGTAYLVMPLIEGETVLARVKRMGGLLPLADVVTIGCAVLDALAAAHAEKIVHCDIKPDNVMVTSRGDIRILDFGIARIFATQSELTVGRSAHGTGTPAYMPPEQARGNKLEFDARTDIYATAAMMFRLITGQHVHDGVRSPDDLALAARTKPARRIRDVAPKVPRAIAKVIDKALLLEKGDRWDSATEMRRELARAFRWSYWRRVPTNFRVEPNFAEMTVELAKVNASLAVAGLRRTSARTLVFSGISASIVIGSSLIWLHGRPPAPRSNDVSATGVALATPVDKDPHIEAGIRLWMRGASSLARAEFARAAEANLSGAKPSLLYWAASESLDPIVRNHARIALTGPLNGFDAELAAALQPLIAQPPAYRDASKPLEALRRRYPTDRVALLAYATQLLRAHENEKALQLAESLGPNDGNVRLWLAAKAQRAMGNAEVARTLLRDCISAAPDATDCLEALAEIELADGQCVEGADTAHDLIAADPDNPAAIRLHANAELGLTGSIAKARAIVEDWSARAHGAYPDREAAFDYALSVLDGNFSGASRAVKKWERAVSSSTDALSHGAVMLAKFDLDRELGRGVNAAADARELDVHSDVWPARDEFDFQIEAARALYLTAQMPRSQFVAARNEAIDREEAYSAYRSTPLRRWLDIYAENIVSNADVQDALAAAPSSVSPGANADQPSVDVTLGHLYLLGGRLDDAIAHLKRATNMCAPMDAPFDHVHAFLWLGDALGRKGKRADACAAFAQVRKHWGGESHSETAAEAARYARRYHCGLSEVAISSIFPSGAH